MRTGSISARNPQSLTVAFGGAPGVIIPNRNYYGRRREDDRVVAGGGCTWAQMMGPGVMDGSRAVIVRANRQVQVGDAPPFCVLGGVGRPNRRGLVASYQNGVLVNRGTVVIPPNKFLGPTDSNNFISLATAAIAPLTETIVVVPGAGQTYHTEDGLPHTVPAGALSDIVLVPRGVPVIRQSPPTPTPGRVTVPTSATIQSLPQPVNYTIYQLGGLIVAINNGFLGVST